MNRQVIGWISLLILVIALSATDNIQMLNVSPVITGVITIGILLLAGYIIREFQKSNSEEIS